jgi:hypothetical protein
MKRVDRQPKIRPPIHKDSPVVGIDITHDASKHVHSLAKRSIRNGLVARIIQRAHRHNNAKGGSDPAGVNSPNEFVQRERNLRQQLISPTPTERKERDRAPDIPGPLDPRIC